MKNAVFCDVTHTV